MSLSRFRLSHRPTGKGFFIALAILGLFLSWSLATSAAGDTGHRVSYRDVHRTHKKHHRTHKKHHRHQKHSRKRAQRPAPITQRSNETGRFQAQHPSRSEIAPYSKHPSETSPYALCPPPTEVRASCLAAFVPATEEGEYVAGPGFQGSGVNGGFAPSDLRSAYNLSSGGGEGMTVAITVAYDNPKAESDLATYRSSTGLSSCTTANGCFKKVNQKGEAKNYPKANPLWAAEASLDLDMVSAVCPKCHIILVEADSAYMEDLGPAVEKAAELGADAISNSWSTKDFAGSELYNSYFDGLGVPSLFASGDSGYGAEYPAASPDVVAVGGTSLFKSANSRGWSEQAWSGAGSGCSASQAKPTWQKDEACSKRTIADVSAVASPSTPVSVYDSYEYPGWLLLAGTSAATPIVAGVEAVSTSAFRAAGPSAFTRAGQSGGLWDPVSGENGICDSYLCAAKVGYDGPTGWGTPNGPQALPVAITEQPTIGSTSKATLRGSVNPGGIKTEYHFEYGTSESYGTTIPIPDKSAGSGSEYVEGSQAVEGLKGQTTYHYRITAINANGTFHGVDRVFSTTAPAATTGSVSAIYAFRATLSGTVNPEAAATTYYFEYGTTTSYGDKMPLGGGKELSSGTTNVSVSTKITGLSGHRLYHYRIAAKNLAGTTYGEDKTFTTDAADWYAQKITKPAKATAPVEALGTSCVQLNSCIAVGAYWSSVVHNRVTLAESWNGSAWSEMSTPNPSGLDYAHDRYAVLSSVSCVSASDCLAVGYYKNTSEVFEPLAERWNGSEWTLLSVPSPSGALGAWLEEVSCTSSTQCTATGYYKNSSGVERTLAERWNGSSWTIQSTPNPATASAARLGGVSCASSTWCTAVGYFKDSTEKQESGFEKAKTLAERWNGSEWTIQSTPNPSSWETKLRSVSCTSSTACTAVGGYSASSTFTLAERWNGSEWTIQSTPTPNTSGGLNSVSCTSASSCTAAGSSYSSTAGDQGWRPLIERWSESTWSVLEIPDLSAPAEWWHESSLDAVSCVNASDCTAIGGHLEAPQGSFAGAEALAEQTVKLAKVTTEPATGAKAKEATLNASVNPEGTATTYYFEYGNTTSYGTKIPLPAKEVGSGISNVAVNQIVTGLSPSTTYHFRVVAENPAGSSEGEDKVFTTLSPPKATTEPASYLNTLEPQLNAVVNPQGLSTKYKFEYGTTTSYGTSIPVPSESVGSGEANVAVSKGLKGLASSTTYHYRVVAENEAGTTNGSDQSFTTLPPCKGAEGKCSWSTQTTANPEVHTQLQLKGVSCVSSTNCTAVGYDDYTDKVFKESWNGTKWTIYASSLGVSSKTGISCVPGTGGSFCLVIGAGASQPGTWRYGVGSTFYSFATPSGATAVEMQGVSCTSETACTAVGRYKNSGGEYKTLAERFNGTSWSIQTTPNPSEGTATSAMLSVSCASSTSCVAVGTANSKPFAERWNGTEWTVSTVPSTGKLEAVSCTSSSACTAVGQSSSKPLAERWNGTEWTVQTTPSPGGALIAELSGVSCSSASSCVAVGTNLTAYEEESKTLIESWNGSEWTIQTSTNAEGQKLSSLAGVSCTASTQCTAVGRGLQEYFSFDSVLLAERWNGSAWSTQTTANPEVHTQLQLKGVSCVSSTNCTAVGYDDYTGKVFKESWNGTKWTIYASSLGVSSKTGISCVPGTGGSFCLVIGGASQPGTWRYGVGSTFYSFATPAGATAVEMQGVSCTSETACTAVGRYKNSGGEYKTLAERFNGTSWSIQTTPNPSEGTATSAMLGVSCASATSCVAVGTANSKPFAERWNGSEWTVSTVPSTGKLEAVSCSSSTSCTAVGQSNLKALVESWNGTEWTVQTTPTPGGAKSAELSGVSCLSPSSCVAVGRYVTALEEGIWPSESKTLIESWNGTEWSIQTSTNAEGPKLSSLAGVSCTASTQCTAVGRGRQEEFIDDGVLLAERYE